MNRSRLPPAAILAALIACLPASAIARARKAAPAAVPVPAEPAAAAAAAAAKSAPYSLARCLGDHGLVFYGASWCPYCAEQKRMFGKDAVNLPYVECSADGEHWGKSTQPCLDADVEQCPSWLFPDGIPHVGIRSREELAGLAGCPVH